MQRQEIWAGWMMLVELHESISLTVAAMESSSLHTCSGPEKSLGMGISAFSISLPECLGEAPGAMESIRALFS